MIYKAEIVSLTYVFHTVLLLQLFVKNELYIQSTLCAQVRVFESKWICNYVCMYVRIIICIHVRRYASMFDCIMTVCWHACTLV